MIKVLDVGSGIGNDIVDSFISVGEKEVVRLDINKKCKPDIVHDITKPLPEELRGQFDIVFCCHMMEHIERAKVVGAFRNMASALKNFGELYVIVPDLEFAAKEILRHRDGLHVQGLLYGAQNNPWEYHRCGFTLLALRNMVEICGLVTRRAYQAPFTLLMGENKFGAIHNVVIAARVDGMNSRPIPQEDISLQGVGKEGLTIGEEGSKE